MSIASIARSSFIVLGILSSSALAFARQPPAVLQAQERADEALCQGAPVVAGAGYRDMRVRFGGSSVESVLAVQTGAGYRDALVRFGAQQTTQVAACQRGAKF